MNLLQSLQNQAARLVSNKDRYTPVRDLLTSCGWLSVRQLVAYHRVLLLFNIKTKGKPKYFVDKFASDKSMKTRFQNDGRIKKQIIYRKTKSRTSFVPDSIDVWNCLPAEMRKIDDSRLFKPRLRTWIRSNIKI